MNKKKKKKNPKHQVQHVNTCPAKNTVLWSHYTEKKPQQFVINTVDICESSAASLALQKNKRKFHP